MSQTSYTKVPNPSFQGMLADSAGAPDDILSRAFQKGAGAAAEFGVAMVEGTNEGSQCALPSVTGGVFVGIAVHRFIAPGTAGTNALTGQQGIEDTQTVDCLSRGRIWVPVEEAVSPGDAVYFRYSANGGNTVLGYWRKSNDAGHTDQLTSARWLSTTLGAGLAVLEINVP